MVRASPPIALNSAVRCLASSKSATAMASAAVTAASAAAALVLFEMGLGFAGEGRLEELFDRKARLVAEHDGHDLLGHRGSLAMVGGSLD
jgi:hypothetical protein